LRERRWNFLYILLFWLVMIGTTELVIIGGVVLLLFGGSKIPELARAVGRAKREFERGMREGIEEDAGKR
jgi:sec-independent protein translocase protein TatA